MSLEAPHADAKTATETAAAEMKMECCIFISLLISGRSLHVPSVAVKAAIVGS
jgi:hypothetical protein